MHTWFIFPFFSLKQIILLQVLNKDEVSYKYVIKLHVIVHAYMYLSIYRSMYISMYMPKSTPYVPFNLPLLLLSDCKDLQCIYYRFINTYLCISFSTLPTRLQECCRLLHLHLIILSGSRHRMIMIRCIRNKSWLWLELGHG